MKGKTWIMSPELSQGTAARWQKVNRLTLSLLTLATVFTAPVNAQGTVPPPAGPANLSVYTLIPELVTLTTVDRAVSFKIDSTNYPAIKWPAYYYSDVREMSVFTSTPKPWSIQLELRDIIAQSGAVAIPASHMAYRVDGGPWIQATGGPQVVLSQIGPTNGWRPVTVEFRLELRGNEPGGAYQADLVMSALVLP